MECIQQLKIVKNKVGLGFWMKALCFIEQADGEFHQNRCRFFGTLAKITLIDVCQLSQHKKAHNLETFYISPLYTLKPI